MVLPARHCTGTTTSSLIKFSILQLQLKKHRFSVKKYGVFFPFQMAAWASTPAWSWALSRLLWNPQHGWEAAALVRVLTSEGSIWAIPTVPFESVRGSWRCWHSTPPEGSRRGTAGWQRPRGKGDGDGSSLGASGRAASGVRLGCRKPGNCWGGVSLESFHPDRGRYHLPRR